MSNARRHGAATHVRITLRREGEFAELAIEDNGRGFDSATPFPSSSRGLANFAERARELGATLDVRSQPGRGTRVKLTLSLHHE